MIQVRATSVVLFASSALLVAAASVRADIVGTGGAAVVAVPPPNIQLDQWESNTEARAWVERTLTLPSSLSLDAVNSGLISSPGDPIPGLVGAGTTITSYMLRADPIGSTHVSLTGYLQFDQPIVGVMFLRPALNGSDDLLGLPNIMYNQNQYRGVDLSDPTEPDSFMISPDRLRLDFAFSVAGWTDDIRIVTAVPSPGGAGVGIVASLLMARRRRRMVLS